VVLLDLRCVKGLIEMTLWVIGMVGGSALVAAAIVRIVNKVIDDSVMDRDRRRSDPVRRSGKYSGPERKEERTSKASAVAMIVVAAVLIGGTLVAHRIACDLMDRCELVDLEEPWMIQWGS
jgi:hypothetical protein